MTTATFPKLTEVGDSAILKVAKCLPVSTDEGEAVEFQWAAFPNDPKRFPRVGVDFALIEMGYVYDGGVVAYDQVAGDFLKFSRTKPKRGTVPAWRIEKAPPTTEKAEPQGELRAVPTAEKVTTVSTGDAIRREMESQEKRDLVHAAYERELAFVLADVLPKVRKAKAVASFDVNAAVATLMIQEDRRGCL
jgi:hypothetical protein